MFRENKGCGNAEAFPVATVPRRRIWICAPMLARKGAGKTMWEVFRVCRGKDRVGFVFRRKYAGKEKPFECFLRLSNRAYRNGEIFIKRAGEGIGGLGERENPLAPAATEGGRSPCPLRRRKLRASTAEMRGFPFPQKKHRSYLSADAAAGAGAGVTSTCRQDRRSRGTQP